MKISISNDPSIIKGTNERCISIVGSRKNICQSVKQILGVLPNKGDGQPDIHYSEQIIIPWTSAGLLIGKVGSTVKRLNEEYHVEVDLPITFLLRSVFLQMPNLLQTIETVLY